MRVLSKDSTLEQSSEVNAEQVGKVREFFSLLIEIDQSLKSSEKDINDQQKIYERTEQDAFANV